MVKWAWVGGSESTLTEAVVAGAAGAVAEFQIGEVRIGPPADLAPAVIGTAPVFPVDALGLPLEVHHVFLPLVATRAHAVPQPYAAEHEVVEDGDQGQQVQRERRADDAQGE